VRQVKKGTKILTIILFKVVVDFVQLCDTGIQSQHRYKTIETGRLQNITDELEGDKQC
jgi:hypothetical protein